MKKMINDNKRLIIIILVALAILRTIYSIYIFKIKYNNFNSVIKEVFVIELIKDEKEKESYLVKYNNDRFILNIYKEENKDFNYKYGDILKINGKISDLKLLNNPNEFNYKLYLNSNNIVGSIYTKRSEKIKEKYGIFLFRIIYSFKNILSENIDKNMESEIGNFFKSILYGDDNNLSESIKSDFSKNGLSHIMAVSGSNISYILIVLEYILCSKKSKKYSLKIFIIISFCIISSFSISILRASIMSIISILNDKYDLKLKKYTSILTSLYIIYLYNPFSIFNISCILSYFAVFSIMVYQNEIYSYLDIVTKKILKYKYIGNSNLKKVIYTFLVSLNKILSIYLAVQILVFPLQIYYFCKIEIISLFSNIFFSPFIFLSLLIASLILFFSFVPFISIILFNAESIVLKLFIYLSKIFSNINITFSIPKPSIILIIIYYIILIIFRYDKKIILIVSRKKLKIVKVIKYIIVILYIIYLICNYIFILYFENYIYYFNVEQGNMAFIRYNQKNILIDCGSTTNNLASNVLKNFCKEKGITNIDLCVITHFHDDHINLLLSENLDISISKIIYSTPKTNNDNFHKIKEIARNKNIALLESNIFDIFEFYNIKLYILSPDSNKKIISDDIENANSIVLLVSINNNNFLFMGDATKETENSIIRNLNIGDNSIKDEINKKIKNLKAIQIGHHGSKTSTSDELLDNIIVENAIISSKKEKFGHPHSEVLEKLEKRNINFFITEKTGAIKFNIY